MNALLNKSLLKNKKEFLILNGTLITYLLLVIFLSPLYPTDEILLYSTDSLTYFNAGSEFFDFTLQGDSIIRPFFYSCFLYYTYNIGGAWLVVILQCVFWIISGNFIFYSTKNISKKTLTPIIAVTIFALNLSLICYVFQGLTEVLSILLISIIAYFIIKSKTDSQKIKYSLVIIFLFALLTVTKPLFLYPFIFSLIIGFIIHFKTFLAKPKFLFILLIATLPVLLQCSVMKVKYDKFIISTIDELTFNRYLLAQGIREVDLITDVEASQQIAESMNRKEKFSYIWNHRDTYLNLYFQNIKDNITGYGSNIILPNQSDYKHYNNFATFYNNTVYSLFYILLSVFILLFFIDLFSKKLYYYWKQILFGLMLYYIIFSSGISFWQGDRLVLSAIPLWIILYTLIITRIKEVIKNKSFVKK